MFAGAEHADAGCPPTNEGSSEVRTPHLVPTPAKQTLTEAGKQRDYTHASGQHTHQTGCLFFERQPVSVSYSNG
ncbi:hypothetical protein SDC9_85392 [bioreactor metagenome]|uniref:Uncharacterized protein n=1 Tax=bioreactor metagenome TaxID=1076179 RepID=A0A644ZCY9_9ZZZZ